MKISEIREIIDLLNWTRNDLNGATNEEFKRIDVPGRLQPWIDKCKALVIDPRFGRDITRRQETIQRAEGMITVWKTQNKEQQISFKTWFKTFLEEKNAPTVSWFLLDKEGTSHFIDTDVVIEFVKGCDQETQKKIKSDLVMIDFKNGDINHYFKFLAQGIVNLYGMEV